MIRTHSSAPPATTSERSTSNDSPRPRVPTASQQAVARLLNELSIAVHRVAMYPPGHPALRPALDALQQRVAAVLADRQELVITITPDRLLADDVQSDARQPLVRTLAERLHRHHLSALSFTPDVTASAIGELVVALSADPDRAAGPLGQSRGTSLPSWSGIRLFPIAVEELDIVDADTPERPRLAGTDLWVGLADAALAAGDAAGDDPNTPVSIARAIERHARGGEYDRGIVEHLQRIAGELLGEDSASARELRQKTAALIAAMDPATLRRLLQMSGSGSDRARLLRAATSGMTAQAVLDLVQSATTASRETVSHGMLRLLAKLAAHAERGPERARPEADAALRDQIQEIVTGWRLDDPNPDDYRQMLEDFSRHSNAAGAADPLGDEVEPLRVVSMALELGEPGPSLIAAVDACAGRRALRDLIALLAQSTPSAARDAVWAYLLSADFIRKLTSGTPDLEALDALLPNVRGDALRPVVDLLLESEDRHLRRTVFDRLRRLGHAVAPLLVARLADERWFVLRNVLALLAEAEALPASLDPAPFLGHPDGRVRREALRVSLRFEHLQERALILGLEDDDPRVIALALSAAIDRCPAAAVGPLMVLAESERLDDVLRAQAVRALTRVGRADGVLDALIRLAGGDARRLRWRSVAPTRTRVAALEALSTAWPHDERAAAVLRRVAASGDLELRQAIRGMAG